MQCSDLQWFYCKDGEIMDANEAMEKRLALYRKIGRELKNAHNRSKECLPPTGLDESIYYRCEGDTPSVETALNNPWVKRVEDFGITSTKGIKRIEDTAVYLGVFPPQMMGMNFILKSRLSRNPRIIQENIEAVYLLRFIIDPYENIAETLNIIIGSIISQISPTRKQKLSDHIQVITNISSSNNAINFKNKLDIDDQVNVSVKNFVFLVIYKRKEYPSFRVSLTFISAQSIVFTIGWNYFFVERCICHRFFCKRLPIFLIKEPGRPLSF